eukprot:9153593-Prorocentrum_lima.AAC.1
MPIPTNTLESYLADTTPARSHMGKAAGQTHHGRPAGAAAVNRRGSQEPTYCIMEHPMAQGPAQRTRTGQGPAGEGPLGERRYGHPTGNTLDGRAGG